jgi:hypothetical protein
MASGSRSKGSARAIDPPGLPTAVHGPKEAKGKKKIARVEIEPAAGGHIVTKHYESGDHAYHMPTKHVTNSKKALHTAISDVFGDDDDKAKD